MVVGFNREARLNIFIDSSLGAQNCLCSPHCHGVIILISPPLLVHRNRNLFTEGGGAPGKQPSLQSFDFLKSHWPSYTAALSKTAQWPTCFSLPRGFSQGQGEASATERWIGPEGRLGTSPRPPPPSLRGHFENENIWVCSPLS